jgi:Rps23 Pro-64 3,4-dihydroxylase Tpa1-like proline 4-hydroxylase
MINVRIVLRYGHVYETACAADDALLEQLAEALLNLGGSQLHQFTIDVGGKPRGVAIPASAILAVETDPPTALRTRAPTVTIERAPYIRIPGFLAAEENRAVLDYAVRKEADFVASKVETDVPDYRRSKVLFDLSDLGIDFDDRVREIVPDAFTYFGLMPPTEATLETQLSTHNDGGYFRVHNDNGTPRTASRQLTYVYYFHREPVVFTGGQIRLHDSKIESNSRISAGTFVEFTPENNMLLLFPSRQMHEVLPTSCSTHAFGDGRFTLNGWVRDPARAAG